MIELDRDASTPIGEQLVEQLRYAVATGRFRPGETLPSTRELGRQLGISFHTARKAYQALEGEGLLEGRPGAGYLVKSRAPEAPADRLERGGAVVQEAVQKLVGLGLAEDEVEYLFQENLAFLERRDGRPKVVFAAAYRELAQAGAEAVSAAVQERVEGVALPELGKHADADVVVVPHASYAPARQLVPQAEVVGILAHVPDETLEQVARLLPTSTLGLVSRYPDAVAPVLAELRHLAGFSGQALAVTTDAERDRLNLFAREVDLLVFTPAARRKLRTLLEGVPHAPLAPVLDPRGLERVRAAVAAA